MDKGTRTGIFFGATSGVITTVGLTVGLQAGTQSVTAVFGGVIVIAVSDSMSDALGIHLAQEADPESTRAHIWAATLWAFVSKFLVVCAAPDMASARSGGFGWGGVGADDRHMQELLSCPYATDLSVAGRWGACQHSPGCNCLVPLCRCVGAFLVCLTLPR